MGMGNVGVDSVFYSSYDYVDKEVRNMGLPELLLRLLIGALVFWIGDRVIGLVKNADLQTILNIILIIAVVLYVIFGSVLPFRWGVI